MYKFFSSPDLTFKAANREDAGLAERLKKIFQDIYQQKYELFSEEELGILKERNLTKKEYISNAIDLGYEQWKHAQVELLLALKDNQIVGIAMYSFDKDHRIIALHELETVVEAREMREMIEKGLVEEVAKNNPDFEKFQMSIRTIITQDLNFTRDTLEFTECNEEGVTPALMEVEWPGKWLFLERPNVYCSLNKEASYTLK